MSVSSWFLIFAVTAAGSFLQPREAAAGTKSASVQNSSTPDRQWANWRGPLRTGESPSAKPPVTWSEDQNVRWKRRLPGLGHSSPVVWGEAVFVTTATAYGPVLPPVPVTAPGAHDNVDVTQRHHFEVLCYRRSDGDLMWRKTVHSALPHEGGHDTGSLASASPVTDGERVFAFFGSYGLHALDFDGNVLWQHQPGLLQSKHAHGEGSSPALHAGVIVINCDHEGASFIRALSAVSGDVIWEHPRDELTSWASPTIIAADDGAQVVVAGTARIRSYELHSGKLLWECGGLSANVVATPVAAQGIVIAASSYDTRAMLAIELADAEGDLTGSGNLLWSTTLRTPYVPSPLVTGDAVYFLRHYQAILSKRDLRSGEETAGPFRLPGLRDIYASPVAADGKIYIADLRGRTLVFTSEDAMRPLALNQLDDSFAATPALVDRQIILRGHKWLYCIEDASVR